jgi:hypothetical protein
MTRTLGGAAFLAILVGAMAAAVGCMAADKPKEIIDLAEAQKDPDFALQGEYAGEGNVFGGKQGKLGMQIVALSKGQFDVYVLEGGLPGAGWKRGNQRVQFSARRDGEKIVDENDTFKVVVADGKVSWTGLKTGYKAELSRVERTSPTLGEKPAEGATVLFKDGKGAENFDTPHLTKMNTLLSGCNTKGKFGEYKMHLEFMLSWMPEARGQGRSNSGVYVHHCYEIQVLDSFGLTGENNECGGFYSIKTPDVNMCLPPLVWQTYDIDYTAPKYDASGNKTANARITLKHNGVTIHDNVELPKATPGGLPEGPAPRALHLQGHGNQVQYNNIWLVEKGK